MILLTPPSNDERKITMTDIALFKQAATEKLPEALYRQLEPHLDSLLNLYQESEAICSQLDYLESRHASMRYDEIRAEFNEKNEPNWAAFARERWPDIDKYFNLVPPEKPSPRSPAEYGSLADQIPF